MKNGKLKKKDIKSIARKIIFFAGLGETIDMFLDSHRISIKKWETLYKENKVIRESVIVVIRWSKENGYSKQ